MRSSPVIATRRATPSVEQWRTEFAVMVNAKVSAAIRLAASEPRADYEATILRLLDWQKSLTRKAS